MKTWAALLLAVALGAACVSAGPAPDEVRTPTPAPPAAIPFLTPTPESTPPIDVPSPGCEFELLITNETTSLVLVDVNSQRAGDIAPDGSLWLREYQWSMPWDVVVSRASDGAQLASHHYEDTDQTEYLPVTDANIAMAPVNCG
jgi:hypothetical protein